LPTFIAAVVEDSAGILSVAAPHLNDHAWLSLDENGAAFDLIVDRGVDTERTQLRLRDFSLTLGRE